jgi:hypothetical protein
MVSDVWNAFGQMNARLSVAMILNESRVDLMGVDVTSGGSTVREQHVGYVCYAYDSRVV